MSDKYPSMSPYNYCANNPVKLIDPNGMEIDEAAGPKDPPVWRSSLENQNNNSDVKPPFVNPQTSQQSNTTSQSENSSNPPTTPLSYEQMKTVLDSKIKNEGWIRVGSGSYGGFGIGLGPTLSFNTYDVKFKNDPKYYTYMDVGIPFGVDASYGGGVIAIYAPRNFNPLNLEGLSLCISGGYNFINGSISSSCNHQGYPTFQYIAVSIGMSFGWASFTTGVLTTSLVNISNKSFYEQMTDGGGGMRIPMCFSKNTKVLSNNTLIDIQNIRVGDTVSSFCIDKSIVEQSIVLKKYESLADSLYEIIIGNDSIYVTSAQPFYVQNKGWVTVEDLELNDLLLTIDLTNLKIHSKRKILWNDKVYNIKVSKNHNYFVSNNKFLVHNK